MQDIKEKVSLIKTQGYLCDVIHDPTYPITDGSVTHVIPLDTCAYIFIPDKDTDTIATSILSDLRLHP
jgi:hypothetical protein